MSPIETTLTTLATIIVALKFPSVAIIISMIWIVYFLAKLATSSYKRRRAPKLESQ